MAGINLPKKRPQQLSLEGPFPEGGKKASRKSAAGTIPHGETLSPQPCFRSVPSESVSLFPPKASLKGGSLFSIAGCIKSLRA